MNCIQQYIDLLTNHQELIATGSCAPLNKARAEATTLLMETGLPSGKEERYRYTDVEAAFAPDYGLNLRRLAPKQNPYATYKCQVPNLSTSLFLVVNDVPCEVPDNVKAGLPEGVIIDSLCRVAKTRPELLSRYNTLASTDRGFKKGHDGVTLLNTALAQDGLLIYLPAGARLKHPLQVVNVSAANTNFMSVRRVLVVAETGAEGTILFCDHASGPHKYLTSQVVEVVTGEGTRLNLYSIEETNERNTRFSTLYAEQAAHSRLTYNCVTLTCGMARNRVDVRLTGEGATTEICGAVVADKEQRVDNNILVEHLAPGCTSDMLYKYVLNDQSVGAFAGKVYVAEGAQKSLSQQTNANLCASPAARAFSQPMLEIYADDVKCNHGSTIGKLDEAALFYMQQRGIPLAEARLLLQHAFINDVLQRVEIEHLRERLAHLVDLRFRGELGKCKGCAMCK